jgi:transcriptional regulator with XRE-family HTH domain
MTQSSKLGEFLRARRARVRPADVGLPAGTRPRRTPGLRREELAALAGLSIDYYIRLERGRETSPGGAVLDGLARALRLDEQERSHLHALAGHTATRTAGRTAGITAGRTAGRTAPERHPSRRSVRPGIHHILENVRPCPAFVLNLISDVLAVNPEGLALLPGLEDWPRERRNAIRYTFLHPAARDLFADYEKTAAGTAANLRALVDTDPHTPGLMALVDELEAASPDFAALWRRHDVQQRRAGQTHFHHPRVGDMTLSFEVLHLSPEGQRVTIYQAVPGSSDQDALTLLSLLAGDERHEVG